MTSLNSQDRGGDDIMGERNSVPCNLISDSSTHLGFQDLNHREQTDEDLRYNTQYRHTGIASNCCTLGTAKIVDESNATTRMQRPARRFRPRARGDDFRRNIFGHGVGAPLTAVHIIRAAATTPWVSISITKQEEEEHEQREQQPKSSFQALQDLDDELTYELTYEVTPPSPMHDSSRFQRLRPPSPMYDSYTTTTTTTSSPYSSRQAPHGRRASIGESQPPHQAPDEPEMEQQQQQQDQQQQQQQPPHMLLSMISCNHTDNTMTSEDDDTIASFFILDDDMSEVTWEGDFHKHLQQHQQKRHQQQQEQQQQHPQTTNNMGKSGVPSWSRFLRPSRDKSTAADGGTAANDAIPSCITVAGPYHHNAA
jgi:hypothetical protein